MWMQGKTVVITGASSGMGKGIAEKLIKEYGCNVIGVARNEVKMKKFVEELGFYAGKFSYELFDVSVKENWEKFSQQLKDNGTKIDVLINNAGILPKFMRFDRCSIEDIEKVMNINFYSAVYGSKYLFDQIMESDTPAIINVDSSAALMSLAGTSAYSASKSALKSLSEAMREEYRGKMYVGIVCPGFTKTDIFRNQGETSSKGQKMMNMISTDCDKMVKMIVNGIAHQKALQVHGKDAWAMDIFGKLLPVNGSRLFSSVMRMANIDLFDGVFKD